MERRNMAFETGAAGAGLAAKYGLFAKLGVMFGAASIGATIIALYKPDTRREWWWHALGAGVGGMFVGGLVLRAVAHYVDWLQPPDTVDEFWDWVLEALAPLLFLFGALFWGFVGALRNLKNRIGRKGGAAIAKRVGL